eukprot:178188-Heterocapsa_arctica.AAC.1
MMCQDYRRAIKKGELHTSCARNQLNTYPIPDSWMFVLAVLVAAALAVVLAVVLAAALAVVLAVVLAV